MAPGGRGVSKHKSELEALSAHACLLHLRLRQRARPASVLTARLHTRGESKLQTPGAPLNIPGTWGGGRGAENILSKGACRRCYHVVRCDVRVELFTLGVRGLGRRMTTRFPAIVHELASAFYSGP